MKKAYILGFHSDFLVRVIDEIVRTGEIVPTYMHAYTRNIYSLKKKFPDCVIHSIYEMLQGVPAEPFSDRRAWEAVDQASLERFSRYISYAYEMLTRQTLRGRGQTVQSRFWYARDMLSYWKTVIKKTRPDLVLFHDTPHFVCNLAVYYVCQEENIPTKILGCSSPLNAVFLIDSIESRGKVFTEAYRSDNGEISESARILLNKLRDSYDVGRPELERKYFDGFARSQSFRSLLKYLSKESILAAGLFSLGMTEDTGSRVPESWKHGSEIYSWKEKYNKILLGVSNYKNYIYYCSRCDKLIDLDKKFVYFAASYQPERTTCPDAGYFSDLTLIVELLAKAIPQDWKIYFKEHHRNFVFDQRGAFNRSDAYYDRLSRIANLEFVPMAYNSFSLIDKAQFVATATGSVGFESIVRGKPVVLFGSVWYEYCDGVYKIKTYAELQEAVSRIQSGQMAPNLEKIENYVAFVERHSCRSPSYWKFGKAVIDGELIEDSATLGKYIREALLQKHADASL